MYFIRIKMKRKHMKWGWDQVEVSKRLTACKMKGFLDDLTGRFWF